MVVAAVMLGRADSGVIVWTPAPAMLKWIVVPPLAFANVIASRSEQVPVPDAAQACVASLASVTTTVAAEASTAPNPIARTAVTNAKTRSRSGRLTSHQSFERRGLSLRSRRGRRETLRPSGFRCQSPAPRVGFVEPMGSGSPFGDPVGRRQGREPRPQRRERRSIENRRQRSAEWKPAYHAGSRASTPGGTATSLEVPGTRKPHSRLQIAGSGEPETTRRNCPSLAGDPALESQPGSHHETDLGPGPCGCSSGHSLPRRVGPESERAGALHGILGERRHRENRPR